MLARLNDTLARGPKTFTTATMPLSQNGVDARAGKTGRGGGGYIRVKCTREKLLQNMYFI